MIQYSDKLFVPIYPRTQTFLSFASNICFTLSIFDVTYFSDPQINPYLWNAYRYLLSSSGTKSIINIYSAWGSKPNNLTWKVGNILRPAFVTIISVPKVWNSSHNCFISKVVWADETAKLGEEVDEELSCWHLKINKWKLKINVRIVLYT